MTTNYRLRLKVFVVFLVGCLSVIRLLKQQVAVFDFPGLALDDIAPTIQSSVSSFGYLSAGLVVVKVHEHEVDGLALLTFLGVHELPTEGLPVVVVVRAPRPLEP